MKINRHKKQKTNKQTPEKQNLVAHNLIKINAYMKVTFVINKF